MPDNTGFEDGGRSCQPRGGPLWKLEKVRNDSLWSIWKELSFPTLRLAQWDLRQTSDLQTIMNLGCFKPPSL